MRRVRETIGLENIDKKGFYLLVLPVDETFSVEIFQAVKDLPGVGGHYRVRKLVSLVSF